MLEVKSTLHVNPSPRMLAEIFWSMDSIKQAEFFHELHGVVEEDNKTNPSSYSLGEMQWLHMADDTKARSPEARDMFLAFTAFAFDFYQQRVPF